MPIHSIKLANITPQSLSSGCSGGLNEYLLVNPDNDFFELFLFLPWIAWNDISNASAERMVVDVDAKVFKRHITRVAVHLTLVQLLVRQKYLFIGSTHCHILRHLSNQRVELVEVVDVML